MPRITNSGVWRVPGIAGERYERAGFHPAHGLAIQSVANDLDRLIVSRCAATLAIQLLDEGYSSKGFGIKAKSCNWGPFAGFALNHVHFAKFAWGNAHRNYQKQRNFFAHGQSDTGFSATDHGGNLAPAIAPPHSSMAAPEVLKLSLARLKYLKRIDLIDFHEIRNYAQIRCDSPFGQMEFKMINLCGNPRNEGVANWGILHRAQFATDNNTIDVTDGNIWELVRGMTNTAASGSAQDPNRQCCAGDYDLWGVFPRRNSAVASTRSLAAHGMDRQMQIFSSAQPNVSQGIKNRVQQLQAATRNQAVSRTHPEYGEYKEDREKGNISALTLHTAREMNRRIRKNGYRGGDMFHHNDDLGNPFRNDVEEELIAFVPGHQLPHFITSNTGGGRASRSSIGWNQWIERFEADFVIYHNPAIHRTLR